MSEQFKNDRNHLDPDLGYVWEDPPQPTPPQHGAPWQYRDADPAKEMAQELVELEWPVAGLRRHTRALSVQPKGRSRQDLAEQLAEHFLDADRLAQSVAELSDEDRRAYTYLLLESNLEGFFVTPHAKGLARRTLNPGAGLVERLTEQGLVLTDNQSLFLPYGLRNRLPSLFVPLGQAREPRHYESAADPRELLSQIQQILGLLQSETAELRKVVRWQAPPYPYAAPVTCWPPVPADAQRLINHPQRQAAMRLQPRAPALDDRSLEAWSRAIGASTERAEFLYHLMVETGLIWSGSPITVDHDQTQAWMSLPAGRQLSILFDFYRNIRSWSAWWSLWRRGEVIARRVYYGYWSLMSVDDAVQAATRLLRWVFLEVLSFVPHNRWIPLAGIHKWLLDLFPTADSHQYLSGLQLIHAEGDWSGFLEAEVKALLTGPLYAMGLVDVAPSLNAAKTVRLKGFQDLHWGRVQVVPLEMEGTLQRNAVRFVPKEQMLEIATPVPPDLMSCVVRWAEPSGLSKNVVRYRLDVQRLHRMFESGENPETLSNTWETCAGFKPLPELKDWWDRWWERYGHVRLYPGQALLQTRDAFTMQELQIALPSLQSSLVGVLTPEAALLKPEDLNQVREDLERQGYMPKETV